MFLDSNNTTIASLKVNQKIDILHLFFYNSEIIMDSSASINYHKLLRAYNDAVFSLRDRNVAEDEIEKIVSELKKKLDDAFIKMNEGINVDSLIKLLILE